MKLDVGLFYGSTTCYTEMAAEKIQQSSQLLNIQLFNIKDVPLAEMLNFDVLILGISTWDFGELQEDWESHWSDIRGLDLTGKVIALFGLGDQIGYADWFQDALGMLHDEVTNQGAVVIGFTENNGYEFTASKALTEDKRQFVGLSLDDENQYDLTDARIQAWVKDLETSLISA